MAGEPRRIGLSGGIGTGKSSLLAHLRACGVPTLDTDRVARDVVRQGTPGYAAVLAAFGPDVAGADGELDRRVLAARVFADPAARGRLEGIVHPAVWEAVGRFFAGAEGPAVVEVPLLFESGHAGAFDRILVADCPEALQLTRVRQRDGGDAAAVQVRIDAQLPREERRRRADAVIDTSGSPEASIAQLEQIWTSWGLPPLVLVGGGRV